MDTADEEPAWKQRAVARSTRAAKLRAGKRVERFLGAAQVLMAEKSSTDFTVQEVVERSRQSLRSFYQHFDGKHELLLALFEDALADTAERMGTAAAEHTDPLDRLEAAVRLLFALSRVSPQPQRPLFTDFAPHLLVSHPAEVKAAHAPVVARLAELLGDAVSAGSLHTGIRPRRIAALVMQTVMFNAQSSAAGEPGSNPLTSDEVWAFCAHGITRCRGTEPAP